MYTIEHNTFEKIDTPPETTPSAIDVAEGYRNRGWVPIPVLPRSKTPCRPKWPESTLDTPLTDFKPDSNIGILLGDPSGGLIDIDIDCREAIVAARYFLPETGLMFGHASKPDSHRIYRVSEPGETKKFQAPGEGMLLEYRANKSMTVFPPSIHESGEPIQFTSEGEPRTVSRTELLAAVGRVSACSLLAKNWHEGSRHDAALALSGGLLRAGWNVADVENFITALCDAAGDVECKDRLKAIETTSNQLGQGENVTGWPVLAEMLGDDVIKSVTSWLDINSKDDAPGIGHNGGPVDFPVPEVALTESGNADRFAAQHGNDARYCHELEHWLMWNKARWEIDHKEQIIRLGDQTARSIFKEASEVGERERRDSLVDWAKRSCNKHVIRNTIELARPKLSISVGKLDANRWLLNCKNGVLNLKTGEFSNHRRADWITKQIPVNYDSEANCDLFLAFLDRIMGGNTDLTAFIQRALGYSLTGITDEQCWFIAHGTGANGKSTLLNLFRKLLGDYASNASVHTFVQKKADSGPSEDLVRLKGIRLVTISEPEGNQRMADSLLKQITGGDAMTARDLYKGSIEFEPQMKLWLATNHKPKIDGSDAANWRRIHMIPFGVVVPEAEIDRGLSAKLWKEAPGILSWAVRGALDWQDGGLRPPETVIRATNDYRTEMDDVRQFIDDCIAGDTECTVTKGAVFEEYRKWADDNGGDKLDKKVLAKRLKAAGLKDGKSGGNRVWRGVRIKDSEWDADDLESGDDGTMRTLISINPYTKENIEEFPQTTVRSVPVSLQAHQSVVEPLHS